MGKIDKVLIYVPAYNVSHTLAVVIDRIPAELKRRAGEILVVDNASSDNTYLTAVQYKDKRGLNNMEIIRNPRNLGYGGSQKQAYRRAIEKGFDAVVMLHGDAQYAPEKIPGLLTTLEQQDADMVFGSRMLGDPLAGGMPLWKYVGNRALTKLQNLVLGLNISEYHSGFRVYRCSALRQIDLDSCSDDYHFDTDILIQLRLHEMKISESPIPTHYGEESRSPSTLEIASYSLNILRALVDFVVRYKLSGRSRRPYQKAANA